MAKQKDGAFWKKILPDGRVVYNGSVTVDGKIIRLNLWENDKGENPKRPDLNAVIDTWVPKTKAAAVADAKSEAK
jgi:hypothetical protein